MRYSILAAAALAASAAAQFLNQTAPFNLFILSSNSTLNGSSLGACHEGAAEEGICLGGLSPFQLNYTSAQTSTPITGFLTYLLEGGNFNLSSPMQLVFSINSNVAVPLFTPSGAVPVAFNDEERLVIPSDVDDTTSPPTIGEEEYERWVVCETYVGYAYTTLAWVFGNGVAQNPTCQSVEVFRVFV